ncbi:MAG: M55 family metallopeptidase [Acidilobaceae archaeon]
MPRRLYVSIDAEGLPGVFHPAQLSPDGKLFRELQLVMGRFVETVADEAERLGYDEVWVADSHGFMGNVEYPSVPDNVVLVRGSPRPVSMVYGIERGFEAAVFIGYHPRAGTVSGVLDHTYSGKIFWDVRINGVSVSEFYLNAIVAGYYGVPVILVAGDDKLRADVEKAAPWVVYVVLKESASRYSTVSRSLKKVLEDTRAGLREAERRLREGEARPLRAQEPLVLEMVFRRPDYAEVAELLPGARRLDGYTVVVKVENPVEAYRVLDIVVLGAFGLESLLRA